MTGREMIHIEEDTVGYRAANCCESLIQPVDRIGQAVGEIGLSDVAQRSLVRNDAALEEDSS